MKIKYLVKSKFNIKKAINYEKAYLKIIEENLFDEEFYVSNYKLNGYDDALEHYLFKGYKLGFDPSIKFNTNFYLNKNQDVRKADFNPLVHYVLFGKEEGRPCEVSNVFKNDLKKRRIIDTNYLHLNNFKFDDEPLVSIIILNKNGKNHLKMLFDDFSNKTNYSNFEVILVDNDSDDDSIDFINSLNLDFSLRIIENNKNLSFSKANNDACKIAKGEYILLLNNDVEPTFGWLNEMMGVMLNNDNVGSVGAKLVYPYNKKSKKSSFKIQHSGDIFSFKEEPLIYAYHRNHLSHPFNYKVNQTKKVVSVTAAAILIKKSVYEDVGGLDEGYIYGWEDIDFSMKLHKKGYNIFYCHSALLFHNESSTRKVNKTYKNNYTKFNSKWDDYLNLKIYFDKINNDKFFCERPLKFLLVVEDINKIPKATKILFESCKNEENYRFELIESLNVVSNFSYDILIAFTPYADNITLRSNSIKILCYNKEVNMDNFDLFIHDNDIVNIKNILKKYLIDKFEFD